MFITSSSARWTTYCIWHHPLFNNACYLVHGSSPFHLTSHQSCLMSDVKLSWFSLGRNSWHIDTTSLVHMVQWRLVAVWSGYPPLTKWTPKHAQPKLSSSRPSPKFPNGITKMDPPRLLKYIITMKHGATAVGGFHPMKTGRWVSLPLALLPHPWAPDLPQSVEKPTAAGHCPGICLSPAGTQIPTWRTWTRKPHPQHAPILRFPLI